MKTKGTIVWDYKQGWNSPELEVPATGEIAIFVDYPDDDLSMPIIELEVEELLSSLGYNCMIWAIVWQCIFPGGEDED